MLARLQVAEIKALDAATMQRLDFALRVEVPGDRLVIDAELHRVEREEVAGIHRQEHRHLGVGGEQEFLLEQEQLAVQVQHVLLEALDVAIQRFEVGLLRLHGAGHRKEQARRQGAAPAAALSTRPRSRAGKHGC